MRRFTLSFVLFFVAGLVLVFLTLAVPIQLEGNWVTIIWAGEATLLFWIGRSRNFPTYEKLSYALIVLTFISLLQDWSNFYGHYAKNVPQHFVRPFLNVQVLSSLLVCLAFAWIVKVNLDKKYTSPLKPNSGNSDLLSAGVPLLLL